MSDQLPLDPWRDLTPTVLTTIGAPAPEARLLEPPCRPATTAGSRSRCAASSGRSGACRRTASSGPRTVMALSRVVGGPVQPEHRRRRVPVSRLADILMGMDDEAGAPPGARAESPPGRNRRAAATMAYCRDFGYCGEYGRGLARRVRLRRSPSARSRASTPLVARPPAALRRHPPVRSPDERFGASMRTGLRRAENGSSRRPRRPLQERVATRHRRTPRPGTAWAWCSSAGRRRRGVRRSPPSASGAARADSRRGPPQSRRGAGSAGPRAGGSRSLPRISRPQRGAPPGAGRRRPPRRGAGPRAAAAADRAGDPIMARLVGG